MTKLLPKVQQALDEYQIEYKVLDCDPELADTAAFNRAYNFTPQQGANTILVASRKVEPQQFAVCVVSPSTRLDVNKAVCKAMGIKRASFADAELTAAVTGMEIGGVVCVALPASLPILIDSFVMEQPEVVMGGGNRTSKLLLDPAELLKLPGVRVVEGLTWVV
jgi:prolyl-tRNA editing enzyme YbaK/EbsC (Cys-tRNA(Pro) deacylase)